MPLSRSESKGGLLLFGIQPTQGVMNVHLAQELLNELGSSLENLEAQQSALLQFLKEKGVVTDDQLAPYLNQAGNASNVRWRAARQERRKLAPRQNLHCRRAKRRRMARKGNLPIRNGTRKRRDS
jgi:hypothetical protein